MPRPCALAALVSATGVFSASAALDGGRLDSASLIQQRSQPKPETFNNGVKLWLDGYYNIVHAKGDELLSDCCEMAKNFGVDPWISFGTASAEQQAWWEQHNCNAVVGSEEEDLGLGTPNCGQNSLSSLLPSKPLASAIHSGGGCSAEDRHRLDLEFFDRSLPEPQHIACQSDNLVADGAVNFTTLASCTSTLLKISGNCSTCYSNFMKNLAGTPTTVGCFTVCFPLSRCEKLDSCSGKAKTCAACVQPALIEHERCLAGLVRNKLTFDSVFTKVLHFTAL